MSDKSYHLIIKGVVQGVSYRYYSSEEAKKLGLKGWVRNLNNGDVEMEISGEEEVLTLMVNWCYQGSPSAEVSEVEVKEITLDQIPSNFEIKT